MKKQKLSLLIATALLASSVSTVAMADTFNFDSNRVYVGGNAGLGQVDADSEYTNDGKNGFGWNVHSGYNFTPQLAAEFGYTEFPGNFGILNNDGNYAVSLVAKWTIPLQGLYGVFGKAGLAYENHGADVSVAGVGNFVAHDDGLAAYFGVGVNYALKDNMTLVGEVDSTAFGGSNLPDMWLISVGLNYQL